jgi:hypothetical protein
MSSQRGAVRRISDFTHCRVNSSWFQHGMMTDVSPPIVGALMVIPRLEQMSSTFWSHEICAAYERTPVRVGRVSHSEVQRGFEAVLLEFA